MPNAEGAKKMFLAFEKIALAPRTGPSQQLMPQWLMLRGTYHDDKGREIGSSVSFESRKIPYSPSGHNGNTNAHINLVQMEHIMNRCTKQL